MKVKFSVLIHEMIDSGVVILMTGLVIVMAGLVLETACIVLVIAGLVLGMTVVAMVDGIQCTVPP